MPIGVHVGSSRVQHTEAVLAAARVYMLTENPERVDRSDKLSTKLPSMWSQHTHSSGGTYYRFDTIEEGDVNVIVHGEPADVYPWYTWYAYRMNFAANLTKIPTLGQLRCAGKANQSSLQAEAITMAHRGVATSEPHSVSGGDNEYYPLYRVNREHKHIAIDLDNGVKAIKWIKLMGYSVFGKRHVGFESAHETDISDWIALRIDGADGDVISNNATANGAFAILHCGTPENNTQGVLNYHAFDRDGLHLHNFANCTSTLRKLNLRLQDHKGDDAHFGRVHLWLKVCAMHG